MGIILRRKVSDTMAFIEVKNLSKVYQMGEVTIKAVENISFEINEGELVVVLGPSGAGKTTVLNILGGMDTPTHGSVIIDGKNISKFKKKELTNYRRYDIGFVFQFYNLVQNLTALENVSLASQICKNPKDSLETLRQVGLKDRANHFPAQLSGGEQQRVSIARALAKNPKLLLCDEPTGALDSKTGRMVLELLQDTCHKEHMTTIIITHNAVISEIADKVIKIKNGQVSDIVIQKKPKLVKDIDW